MGETREGSKEKGVRFKKKKKGSERRDEVGEMQDDEYVEF